MKTIYFDMDGTIADLYGVYDWLKKLRAEDASPYREAPPLCDMVQLTEICQELQKQGYRIGIISWLSKQATLEYKNAIRAAKIEWLNNHMPIDFDEKHIIQYGYSKRKCAGRAGDILIDDEKPNLLKWKGRNGDRISIEAKDGNTIIQALKELIR